MSKYDELSPFFAPVCNDFVNFEDASLHAINSSKVFIMVITEDFCVSDVPSNDQIRKEIIMLARKMEADEHIEILPVMINIPVGDARGKGKKLNVGSADVFSQLESWLIDDEEANLKIWKELVLQEIDRISSDKEPDLKLFECVLIDKNKNAIFDKLDKKTKLNLLKQLCSENNSWFDQTLISVVNSALRKITDRIGLLSDKCRIDEGGSFKTFISSVVDATAKLYRNRQEISDGYVWVGTRLSDMDDVTDEKFKGAVTLFGTNDEQRNLYAMCGNDTKSGRVDHNAISADQDRYIFDTVSTIAEQNPKVKFYFYNQGAYYNVKKDINGRAVSLCEAINMSRCICVNKQAVINSLNDKMLFHKHFGDVGRGKGLLDVIAGKYHDCSYDKLCAKFDVSTTDGYKFIIQEKIASGGNGTYIMTKQNETRLRTEYLKENSDYLLSIYRENNVPVNMHAIIFDDGVLFTPGSIQVMRVDYESIDGSGELRKLMYRGADFIEFERIARLDNVPENKVNGSHVERFKKLCAELCDRIKEKGYRGVLGIDGIIYDDEVRILEVNCRFQASTGLINRALKENGSPSVQEINIAATNRGRSEDFKKYFDNLTVRYSNYSYNHIGEDEHVERVLRACEKALANGKKSSPVCALEKDGFDPETIRSDSEYFNKIDTSAHLFRVVFDTNICWVNEDGAVNLDECVSEPVKEYKNKILNIGSDVKDGRVSPHNLLALKIALLTQGVNFVADDIDDLKSRVRPATNDAVDILFDASYYDAVINAPLNNKFQIFTPFDLKVKNIENMVFTLYYYDKKVTDVKLYATDPLEYNADGTLRVTAAKDEKGNPYKFCDVAYLSTDRLRVHVTNSCVFKKAELKGGSKSCKFCNIRPSCNDITLDAIKEVVAAHVEVAKQSGLRHFLIGGQSPEQNEKTIDKVVSIINIIKSEWKNAQSNSNRPDAEIYAMILPCDKSGIEKMKEAGLRELSFNIELFDDGYAKKYMPGKGAIDRDRYKTALKEARDIWFREKGMFKKAEAYSEVRSMVILGLEPEKSFVEGIKWMIREKIQPIISLFRPLKYTSLCNIVAPSMIYVYNMYFKIQKMINEAFDYGKSQTENRHYYLGPGCTCCQNNTLSLPIKIKL